MRGLLVIVHRWAGLFIAVFLFIAGVTGSVISWDHELDEWLNPDLFDATQAGTPLPPLELVARFEAANPHARVTYFPLSYEQGKSADLFVEPRIDADTGRLYELDYNQAYVEPATGEVLGTRFWGRISLDRRDILPFLYKLHYSMHIPDFYGYDRWGIWLMGIVGIVWTFDCFVGLLLTFPPSPQKRLTPTPTAARFSRDKSWLSRWAPAWQIKRNASAYRLNFDIHRAAGLWTWLFLLILAFTSISMNLGDDIVRPLLGKISTLTADAEASRTPAPIDKPIPAALSFASILDRASDEAAKRSWQEPLGSTFYNQQTGVYGVSFFETGKEHGEYGLEPRTLYFDGNTGTLLGDSVPWAGTAADIFMQLQFPLHSGRIAGLPGRILLTIMGIVVAVLSFTGIVIWFKKRLARLKGSDQKRVTRAIGVAGKARIIAAGTYRFFLGAGDQSKLRQRLTALGIMASEMSDAPGPLPLRRIALWCGEAALLIVRVLFVGVGSIFARGRRLLAPASASLASLVAVTLTRNFWRAGMHDAAYYLRTLRFLCRYMKVRGLSFTQKLSSLLVTSSRRI
ncbi:MAG: PepSY-associated TM helix domain-containing protein [Hyphomicrobium sp.]|uniref:PepSY-associated TM helix domain-containing protein n=1 Tax=Hyphomicrobium sp. TaxID=82 RepID=UPI0039E4FFAE